MTVLILSDNEVNLLVKALSESRSKTNNELDFYAIQRMLDKVRVPGRKVKYTKGKEL